MRAELLFSLILVALGASAVRAHPTTPNDAIGAPTIAQLFLDTGRARLELAREERIGVVAFWALGFYTPSTWASVADVATPKL